MQSATPKNQRYSNVRFLSLSVEELPMTLQVGMLGENGIVLASDTKIYSEAAGRTITSGVSKIKIGRNGKMAVSCARDMNGAYHVADALISELSESIWEFPEGSICDIAVAALKSGRFRGVECLIALSKSPYPSIHFFSSGESEGGEFHNAYCAPVTAYAFCGHASNSAVFWADRFFRAKPPRYRSIEELMPLAAQIIFDGGELSSGAIGGLELVLCDSAGIHPLSRDQNIKFEADAYARGGAIENMIFPRAIIGE
jgi:hypothetical protein